MTKQDEPIHVKCNGCGEIFNVPRSDLDQPANIVSITQQFVINVKLPHPVFNNVGCQYALVAECGDYCAKCCIEFLETGLESLKQQLEAGILPIL